MNKHEAWKIIGNQPRWAIRNMIKALELPISRFLNTDEDNQRLAAARIALRTVNPRYAK